MLVIFPAGQQTQVLLEIAAGAVEYVPALQPSQVALPLDAW
jgi:hypothetical protein